VRLEPKEQSMSWDDEDAVFRVVINHEEQYSIWPEYRDIPNGWREVGKRGSKSDCLAYIDEVWTDMRPLSLRKHMESLGTEPERS
jgi:MbtH protein